MLILIILGNRFLYIFIIKNLIYVVLNVFYKKNNITFKLNYMFIEIE